MEGDRDPLLMHLQIDRERITYSGPQNDYSISELTALYREHNRQQRIDYLWHNVSVLVPWVAGLLLVAIAVLSLPGILVPNQSQRMEMRQ